MGWFNRKLDAYFLLLSHHLQNSTFEMPILICISLFVRFALTLIYLVLRSIYACYRWTSDDLVAIKALGRGISAETSVCEESLGHVFTQGLVSFLLQLTLIYQRK